MLTAVKSEQNLEQALGRANVTATLPEPTSNWVMILVRPGGEQEARDSLRRRGIGAWWPNFQKEVGAKDRDSGKRYKRLVLTGVLPCVLFSPARLTQQFWAALDLAPGVINVVRKSNTEVVLLNDVDIAMIHAIEVDLNRAPAVRISHSHVVGDVVRLMADEYRRIAPGKVIGCHNGYLEVEVNMFGAERPILVLPTQVELVEEAPRISVANRPPMRGKGPRSHPKA